MSDRTQRRSELGLTQTAAAARAGVSLATWRRWEEKPETVSAKTRTACERVLSADAGMSPPLEDSAAAFNAIWRESPELTPRQAYAIATTLGLWADYFLGEWLKHPDSPLHEIEPFDRFDLRVMMLVGENRAWAEAVRARCHILADEIESGTLPFQRSGPLIDEVLMGAAVAAGEELLRDSEDFFEGIESRDGVEDEESLDYLIGDEDWEVVIDGLDDRCRWSEWDAPTRCGDRRLPGLLAERHPFRWFDES
jgi:transcriptional regulator with XRE-family HTH domain